MIKVEFGSIQEKVSVLRKKQVLTGLQSVTNLVAHATKYLKSVTNIFSLSHWCTCHNPAHGL